MKQIENNLLAVANAMFGKGNDWDYVTDEQKETFFFIINRNMSKKFPEKAQLLNSKTVNKVVAMDIWHNFMLNQPYPKWFWSKSTKKLVENFNEKDYKLLIRKLNIKDIDLDYLIENNPEFINDELK